MHVGAFIVTTALSEAGEVPLRATQDARPPALGLGPVLTRHCDKSPLIGPLSSRCVRRSTLGNVDQVVRSCSGVGGGSGVGCCRISPALLKKPTHNAEHCASYPHHTAVHRTSLYIINLMEISK